MRIFLLKHILLGYQFDINGFMYSVIHSRYHRLMLNQYLIIQTL